MGILEFFKPVAGWPPKRVQAFLEEHDPGDCNLVDVRQPAEYAAGHIPGAQLLPAGQLEGGLGDLDRHKPTIVYCNSGVRSQAAAAVLSRAGFHLTFFLEGGLEAWEGQVAGGTPEAALVWFFPAHSPEQYLALAWLLEAGTRRFYAEVATLVDEPQAAQLFRDLARAEERHLRTLEERCVELTGHAVGDDFPYDVIDLDRSEEAIMEGGASVRKALAWARGKGAREVLEMAVGIETVAYDRYLFLLGQLGDDASRAALRALAGMERAHLQAVSGRLDALLADSAPRRGVSP